VPVFPLSPVVRPMPKPANPVEMAVIGAAQGIRGEVRVKSFTGDPMAIGDYGPLFDEAGRAYEIVDIRPGKTVVIVRFKGVGDRTAAEALNGTLLFVDRSQLPTELEEGEFYHADLVGMQAFDEEGAPLGRVSAVFDFGGGDLLEITGGGRKPVLVPFTQAAVPTVDPDAGRIVVDRTAAGLLEAEEDGEAADDEMDGGGE
jgi:16S rRNA processing protein RimM